MKVAITCDYLLGRSHYTEIIESLCEVFPEAVIYCFAHKQGAILGHIEQRSIKSTFLSNVVETEEDFYKHYNKLPSLAKNLFVSCEYDLIINVSKGFSQGFSKCKKTKLISYIYDLDIDKKFKKTISQKLFSPFVKSWITDSIAKCDLVLASREDLVLQLKKLNIQSELMPAPFRVSDYALFPKEMFKHHFYLIESKGLNPEEAQLVAQWMKEWNYEFQFIGLDEHLESIKTQYSSQTFFGNRCSGEHAPVMAASRTLISFNKEDFPALSLGALATGRPIIIDEALTKWVKGYGIESVKGLNKDSLKVAIDRLIPDSELEPKKVRAHIMDYHDIKFKSGMKRILEKSFTEIIKGSDGHAHSGHDHDHEHSSDCSQCN